MARCEVCGTEITNGYYASGHRACWDCVEKAVSALAESQPPKPVDWHASILGRLIRIDSGKYHPTDDSGLRINAYYLTDYPKSATAHMARLACENAAIECLVQHGWSWRIRINTYHAEKLCVSKWYCSINKAECLDKALAVIEEASK